ncbi:phosphoglucosamine mutase [Candidatus Falkowbacteria bacterium HGW-Falkowbacteria-1]|uniref:Phosphoglucosamine mutase n=1 Tax=Candidatus Falkowbacteria bacterium HGW-Falkowbacteria-1 TaxID=2013768 RepID=A0A2N2E8I6_9BACT|nr:MAG: phosphoglucosamine mutase [Candidatus Falkowbacteria bacterium HGW-Falkowbacteria-1]
MAIISSISGIRGTVGAGNDNLNPVNFINFVLAFGEFLKKKNKNKKIKIVVGRDGRMSGEMFLSLAINSLISLGIDVVNIDLASTPTIEIAVINEVASGGIIISASHNPREWNALKLLNEKGEFLDKVSGETVLNEAKMVNFSFVAVNNFGKIVKKNFYTNVHASKILKLPLIDKKLIKKRNFKIVVDGINSVGSVAVPILLKELGVKNVVVINKDVDGNFNHNPEPIEKNLKQLFKAVKKIRADLGIAVDPDVDRLAFVDEKGNYFGEENTLVSVSKYVLESFSVFKSKYKKVSVSNLSSSLALKDVSEDFNAKCFFAAVGEANVVSEMKKKKAVIGGEGNGGIIYPEFHYGRDALVGVALFLTYLVKRKIKVSELKEKLPQYFLLKDKIELKKGLNIDKMFDRIEKKYKKFEVNKTDGLKIVFTKEKSWAHLRKSNTEPIIRIYCEAPTKKEAENLFKKISNDF